MRYSLVVNGHEIGNYIAGNGVHISKDERVSKSVVTMAGIKFSHSIEKINMDVTLMNMPDSYFTTISTWLKLASPATVSYTDFEQGQTLNNRLFYVHNLTHEANEVIGDVTYLTGISFSMEER